MTEQITKFQCPTCGGPLHFDTDSQLIECEYCDSKFPKSQFEDETDTNETPIDWSAEGVVHEHEVIEGQSGFVCTSCGAEVVSDGNTAATECMYCGNPIVLNENVSGMVKPDLILPFKIDKEEAEKMLKNFYNRKILLPSAFKDKNRIKKIAGIYVPFWLFSGKGEGSIDFNAETSSTHRSGDYKITTTKHFKVKRAGSLEFHKIPVDASIKMEDNYMDGLEPYDYSALEEFSASYMAGYFADKFDVSVEDCQKRATIRVRNSTNKAMRDTVKGYSHVSETHSSIDFYTDEIKYTLLPVWVLNTKFEDKMYHFAINGQTGKVSGDLPIDKKKKLLLEIGLSALALIPLVAFAYNYLI